VGQPVIPSPGNEFPSSPPPTTSSGDIAMLHAQWSAEELAQARPSETDPPLLLQSAILAYELGDLVKCAMNTHWGGIRGYQGEAHISLADVITQARLMAHHLGLDFWTALREGEERYMERMTALKRGEYRGTKQR